MVDDNSNDNEVRSVPAPQGGPDPHGHAALLLVESLIHGLIARSVISVEDAVDIVEIATDANVQIAAGDGHSLGLTIRSTSLLERIGQSLKIDMRA